MARTDVLVLGAGIVGTSIALHLAKRGLAVALIDRAGAGEGTSYGNAGIIEGNTIFPQAFPSDLGLLADCDWVIEAVTENLAIKQALIEKIGPHLKPDAILTTNTSGIPIAS